MRLKSIHLEDYNQFKNVHLDLTYPEGHPKAGEPLDKICIIGDNGTGKTTLLDLISSYYRDLDAFFSQNQKSISTKGDRFFHDEEYQIKVTMHNLLERIAYDDYETYSHLLLYFPAGPDLSTINLQISTYDEIFLDKKVFDFNDSETHQTWMAFRNELKKSVEREQKYKKELALKFTNEINIERIKKGVKEATLALEKYKKANLNNLEKLKNYFDPLLKKFHLEIDGSIDLDNLGQETFLSLKTTNDQKIPMNQWSTGIRQLLYTLFPLYALQPKKSIVLIDEPERSLYPNTQKILIDFYTSMLPEAQFIFATHSPIIASSFDPWEVIELEFTPEGNVKQKLYYDESQGRHVDNYFIHPKYLRWDSILEKLFSVEEESNSERVKRVMELAVLERKIKKESDKTKKKELWKEYDKIATLLDWKTLDNHAEN